MPFSQEIQLPFFLRLPLSSHLSLIHSTNLQSHSLPYPAPPLLSSVRVSLPAFFLYPPIVLQALLLLRLLLIRRQLFAFCNAYTSLPLVLPHAVPCKDAGWDRKILLYTLDVQCVRPPGRSLFLTKEEEDWQLT